MVLLASAGLSSLMSSWPRMQSGQKNPFQNAPGPFIYALPNLAGTCPFSCCSDMLLLCSFPGDSNAPSACDPPHRRHHHHDRCCHSPAETSRCSDSCCRYDPPSESAELPTAFTKEGVPNTEPPPPSPPPSPSAPSLSPSDECHFGLGDIISPSPLTEGETEVEQQQQQQQQQESQASAPPTPTRSNAPSSPTGSDFQEGAGSKEDGGEGGGEGKGKTEKGKGRRERKRNRNRKQAKDRSQADGTNSIAPRFMGLSGVHCGLWAQYVYPQAPPLPVYPPPPPPPPAMNYHHYGGFVVVPPNTVTSSPALAPLFWNPIVPATGFVAVPVA